MDDSMIHFDFIVDDIDAENIMDCIHQEVLKCKKEIHKIECGVSRLSDKSPEDREAYINGYQKHAKYLQDLMKKMKNQRVEGEQ